MSIHFLSKGLGLLLLTSCLNAFSAATQELEPIRRAIEEFMLEQNKPYAEAPIIHIGKLDPRLHLAHCIEGIEAFIPTGARTRGNTTVGVCCHGPKQWTIYLPVAVNVFGMVLVADRTLPQGITLETTHVRYTRRNLSTLPSGYISDATQVVGMRLKRSLASGEVLTPTMLVAPLLVHRGDQVNIVLEHQGLQIRALGKALKDGAAGVRIPVRNLSSAKVVEGTVVAAGTVKVML
jgi:flagella basal body P-ring formation protein FlgA